jgi:hypothetical protein
LRNSEAFNNWINSLALIDLKCTDRNFTWARGGKSSQMACLDRILVNQAWLTLYPNTHTFNFSRTMSDHSPICLINGESSILTTSQFRFETYWLNQDGFFELMLKWWSSPPPPRGPISAQVWKWKLNQLKLKLKGWSANIKKDIRIKKQHLSSSVSQYELLLEQRDLSDEEYESFFSAKNDLCNIYRDEVLYWQQRVRLQWLHKGDANTKFFHAIAPSKKRSNLISSLHIDGVECRDSSVITNHIFFLLQTIIRH